MKKTNNKKQTRFPIRKKESKQKIPRKKLLISSIVLAGLYLLALFFPLTHGLALYPVALMKCGKQPVIGIDLKGKFFYRPGDHLYTPLIGFDRYFCSVDEAKAADYKPAYPNPEEKQIQDQRDQALREQRAYEKRYDLSRIKYTAYMPTLDEYLVEDKAMLVRDDGSIVVNFIIKKGNFIVARAQEGSVTEEEGYYCSDSHEYCEDAGFDTLGRKMTRRYSTWNERSNMRVNSFVDIGGTRVFLAANGSITTIEELAKLLGSMKADH